MATYFNTEDETKESCDNAYKVQLRRGRNLKLWNHWIAEFRDIAKESGKFKYEDGTLLTMNQIRLNFGEGMKEYFEEGLTPQEAVDEYLENSN